MQLSRLPAFRSRRVSSWHSASRRLIPQLGQGTAFNPALPLTHVDNGPNSAWAQSQHYLVLVSLDGFRWDYAKRDNADQFLALGKAGVWAPEGMFPSYPSLTFPNHYTIVTGLYPEHTGIVANSFLDPARQARYSMSDAKAVTDGSWYGGVPLWSLAESQGMRTACLLLGRLRSEDRRLPPSYYAIFDAKPKPRRSTAGAHRRYRGAAPTACRRPAALHRHLLLRARSRRATNSVPMRPRPRAAVLKMDALIGKLRAALDATGLPIDLVVVSDHGMVKSEGGWINLDQFADLSGFDTVGRSALRKDRRGSRPRLQPAQEGFVAIHRLPAQGCSGRSRITTRIRARAIRLSWPPGRTPSAHMLRPAGQPDLRPLSACTASIRTRCRR